MISTYCKLKLLRSRVFFTGFGWGLVCLLFFVILLGYLSKIDCELIAKGAVVVYNVNFIVP